MLSPTAIKKQCRKHQKHRFRVRHGKIYCMRCEEDKKCDKIPLILRIFYADCLNSHISGYQRAQVRHYHANLIRRKSVWQNALHESKHNWIKRIKCIIGVSGDTVRHRLVPIFCYVHIPERIELVQQIPCLGISLRHIIVCTCHKRKQQP